MVGPLLKQSKGVLDFVLFFTFFVLSGGDGGPQGQGVAKQGGMRHLRAEVPSLQRVPHNIPACRKQGLRVSTPQHICLPKTRASSKYPTTYLPAENKGFEKVPHNISACRKQGLRVSTPQHTCLRKTRASSKYPTTYLPAESKGFG